MPLHSHSLCQLNSSIALPYNGRWRVLKRHKSEPPSSTMVAVRQQSIHENPSATLLTTSIPGYQGYLWSCDTSYTPKVLHHEYDVSLFASGPSLRNVSV